MKDSTHCLTENRRQLARRKAFNGIDYVDIGDHSGIFGGKADAQTYLTVFFLGRLHTAVPGKEPIEWQLSAENFRITGGHRITNIRVLEAIVARPKARDEDDMVVLKIDQPGDFSCYTLEVVEAQEGARPAREGAPDKHRPCQQRNEPLQPVLRHFDQRYRSVSFSFKANCPATVDCAREENCAPPRNPAPFINYLAKDYTGFRELILDRLALTMPEWRERHVPDVGIAVAEVLAYAADHLSYYQDAIGAEAYLGTARKRISVRRHVRLVDYYLHEGCNARAWVCCNPDSVVRLKPEEFCLLTKPADEGGKPLVFEPVVQRRGPRLEIGDFFDLRHFAWKLLHGDREEVARRLPSALLAKLEATITLHTAEAPVPADLASELVNAINERVLGDHTFASNPAVADLGEVVQLNRTAFEELCREDLVGRNEIYLNPAHEEIQIYTWHGADCCLEAGATECVLLDAAEEVPPNPGRKPESQKSQKNCPPKAESPKPPVPRRLHLRVGDVIVFEEVTGPQTGNPSDADATRRRAVRLTAVEPEMDALTGAYLLRVRWAQEDALPFSFCLSKVGSPPDCEWLERITVVRGNAVLVDHGETLKSEELGTVEREKVDYQCRCVGVLDEITVHPRRFRPDLNVPNLTFAVPLGTLRSATATVAQKPWEAVPALKVSSLPPVPDGSGPVLTWEELKQLQNPSAFRMPTETVRRRALRNLLPAAAQGQWLKSNLDSEANQTATGKWPAGFRLQPRVWSPVLDLLHSSAADRHFVAEIDNERRAWLRFGGEGLGLSPEAGESFCARYRSGNGPEGNVGRETITVFRSRTGGTLGTFAVRNPLPAQGGTLPETLDNARRNAPHVFRLRQLRAITAEDYARLAEKNPRVQRAGAEHRWTGSRQCIRVALDPLGSPVAASDLITEVRDALLLYRRIGHDLEVIPAHYAAVDLTLQVCVDGHVLRGDVEVAVRDALTAGFRRDGTPGFFHPDRLTFGDPVRISRIIAAVQVLPGVMSARVTRLQRWGGHPLGELEQGFLPVSPLEVARLDQDPDFPENGTLTLNLGGGR